MATISISNFIWFHLPKNEIYFLLSVILLDSIMAKTRLVDSMRRAKTFMLCVALRASPTTLNVKCVDSQTLLDLLNFKDKISFHISSIPLCICSYFYIAPKSFYAFYHFSRWIWTCSTGRSAIHNTRFDSHFASFFCFIFPLCRLFPFNSLHWSNQAFILMALHAKHTHLCGNNELAKRESNIPLLLSEFDTLQHQFQVINICDFCRCSALFVAPLCPCSTIYVRYDYYWYLLFFFCTRSQFHKATQFCYFFFSAVRRFRWRLSFVYFTLSSLSFCSI